MISLCLALSLMLISCRTGGEAGDMTAPSGAVGGGSGGTLSGTTSGTTAASTEYDYSKIPDVIEPHESKTVPAEELGLDVHLISTEKYYVANAARNSDGDITVTSYNPGTTVITVRNTYGEAMTLDVTVGLDYSLERIDVHKFEMPKNYVNALDFGLDPDSKDNAEALQAAINALPRGGVVYIPKGRYATTYVELKSNVALRLEGILPEYNTEYSEVIASLVSGGEFFAVLASVSGDMFVNTPNMGAGRNGADNIEITGGVIDMEGRSRAFVWACADGVLLRNVIMKDCPNDHAIQVTGCENVTISDCMFAGYNFKNGTTGAECIQIETSHPGATGAASWAPAQFEEYEYYDSKNVRIENCYFGKSDEYDSATYFIGHHGHHASESLVGLKVLGCTFDNPRVVAFRAYAFSDVEIAECRFISDRANSAVPTEGRFMIEMNLNSGDVRLPSGAYLTKAETRGGCRNYRIHDNEFIIDEESLMGGFVKTLSTGTTWCDAKAYVNLYETDFYKNTPKNFTGYKLVTNNISNIRIYGNKFTVKNEISKILFDMVAVRGLEFKDNNFDVSREHISNNLDGVRCYGAYLIGSTSVEQAKREFRIGALAANRSVPIILQSSEGDIKAYCTGADANQNYILTVKCDKGGTIERAVGEDGTLYVKAVAEEGYAFDGYYVNGKRVGNFVFAESTAVTAVFVKI